MRGIILINTPDSRLCLTLLALHTQEFDYDALNRLTHITQRSTRSSTTATKQEWVRYAANGNITWKKDMGYYCYNSTRPHAVSRVQSNACSGTEAGTYHYDDWGNMTSDALRTITYSDFDKAESITKSGNGDNDSKTTTFAYDTGRSRYERITDLTPEGENTATQQRTLYFGNVERIYERDSKTAPWVHKETRRNLGGLIQTISSSGNETSQFLHKDNLGSLTSITDENNRLLQKFYFDPWGKKHLLPAHMWSSDARANQAPTLAGLLDITPRGFTGHEHVDHADIIHMNGRIYDPSLGRFLQADPHIQAPNNSQNYNRYSYVLNNPLNYTDPSGYFFKKLFRAINKALGDFAPIVAIAIGFWNPGALLFKSAWAAGAATGFIAGGVATGSLKGALIGAFTGGITQGLGLGDLSGIEGFLANGAVGGVGSLLSGGKFGHGFLSAGVSSSIQLNTGGTTGQQIGRVFLKAVIGGSVSRITGGKFGNGAATAAFSEALRQGSVSNQSENNNATRNANKTNNGEKKVAFVGGFFDKTIDGPVINAYRAYKGDKEYFTWDQDAELADWIDTNADNELTVIGHSYGGDTAATVVSNGHQVDHLITIDPVGWTKPNFSAVAANSGTWSNYNAIGGGYNFANVVAIIGGAWNHGPASYATFHRNVNADHAYICVYYCRP